ncbi:MAG: acyltransferase [Lautropia sp.]|nr:acyltransferase [Lautropia sp.]
MDSLSPSPACDPACQAARPTSSSKTLYSLQALRFIAAALVLVSHIRNEYGLSPFGSSGVDIFFVISGFIIHYVTRDGAPQFFVRRLIRIVPLYWLGTLALAAVAIKAPSLLHQTSVDLPTLLASLFFIPVWNDTVQYHMPLLTLGWSLNYEILFYLVFFIAMKISHQHRLAISALLLLALTSLHPYVATESALAFWSDAYIVEFIYGMVLAQVLGVTRFTDRIHLPLAACLAGLALYTWALLPDTGLVTPQMALDKWLRIVVIGLPSTALIILTLACEQSFRAFSPRSKSVVNFLGELSYPIYIFHIYVMGAMKRLGALGSSLPVYSVIVFAATLGVASAVYLLYEQPIRKLLSQHLLRKKGKDGHPPQNALPLSPATHIGTGG